MRFLNFAREKEKTNDFVVISPLQQIINKLESISESNDKNDYCGVISEMKKHLNYKEVEVFVNSIKDFPNKSILLELIELEKYFWYDEIEKNILSEVEYAKISLCTSDLLAFIIGKKYDLHILINQNSLWSKIYKSLDLDLNVNILQGTFLCNLEGSQKANVPVNYALSMFLLYDKKEALAKFKRVLNVDRQYRLEASHQAEYLLIFERFFDRLKIDFIPKINSLNQQNPICFENNDNQYIKRDEINLIIDRGDYFNKRVFNVDPKKLLNPRKLSKKELLLSSYILFFKSIDPELETRNVDIFISCLTELNPKYEEIEIKEARFILCKLLEGNQKSFLVLNNLLDEKQVFVNGLTNLGFLLNEFFKDVKGMSFDTIKNILHERKTVNIDYSIIPIKVIEHIDKKQ